MGLTVAHINRDATTLEAKARADADKLFSKLKPGEVIVNMTKTSA